MNWLRPHGVSYRTDLNCIFVLRLCFGFHSLVRRDGWRFEMNDFLRVEWWSWWGRWFPHSTESWVVHPSAARFAGRGRPEKHRPPHITFKEWNPNSPQSLSLVPQVWQRHLLFDFERALNRVACSEENVVTQVGVQTNLFDKMSSRSTNVLGFLFSFLSSVRRRLRNSTRASVRFWSASCVCLLHSAVMYKKHFLKFDFFLRIGILSSRNVTPVFTKYLTQ